MIGKIAYTLSPSNTVFYSLKLMGSTWMPGVQHGTCMPMPGRIRTGHDVTRKPKQCGNLELASVTAKDHSNMMLS